MFACILIQTWLDFLNKVSFIRAPKKMLINLLFKLSKIEKDFF